jgi:transposase
MIGPSGTVRVLVATKPVDFRKGADGLAALVRDTMGADPFSGTVYVFRAKRADRVKLVFWDGTGVFSWLKGWRTASSAGPRCRMVPFTCRRLNSRLCSKVWTGAACMRRARPRRQSRRVDDTDLIPSIRAIAGVAEA